MVSVLHNDEKREELENMEWWKEIELSRLGVNQRTIANLCLVSKYIASIATRHLTETSSSLDHTPWDCYSGR